MKGKKYVVFSIILALVLLYGCAEYKYSHVIEETGDSNLKLSIDYTSVIEKEAEEEGKTFSNKVNEFEEEKNIECNEIMENSNVFCEVKNAVVEISVALVPGEYYEFSKENEVSSYSYMVEINKIPNLNLINNILGIEEIDLEKELTEDEKLKLDAGKELDLILEYSITMPGNIEEAHFGEIEGEVNGNSVTFSLLDAGEGSNTIFVKSRKADDSFMTVVLGLGVVVLIGLLYVIFLRSSSKKKK